MAAHSSLTSEVLNAIKMPNIRPFPPYLVETDAVTSDIFMQSEYAQDYTIDTSNIHWGGEIHHDHVHLRDIQHFKRSGPDKTGHATVRG